MNGHGTGQKGIQRIFGRGGVIPPAAQVRGMPGRHGGRVNQYV
jgi:hypothetical protein